jgi:hypothetical protein
MLAGLTALAVEIALLVPLGVVTAVLIQTVPLPVATVATLVLANAYGAFIWLRGREIAVNDSWWRLPELLDAVSPRQAG